MKDTNPGMTRGQVVNNVEHQLNIKFTQDGQSRPAGYSYYNQIDRNEAKRAVSDHDSKKRKSILSNESTKHHLIPDSLLMFEHLDVS